MKQCVSLATLAIFCLAGCSVRPAQVATPTQAPTESKFDIGSTLFSDKDGMTLVYVPAGEFVMGSDRGASDEKPVHSVYLDAFWIDRTEVTNAMYDKCLKAGQCNPHDSNHSNTRNPYYGNLIYDDYPVIFVTWEDASAYCAWAGRRLPTEAEWEKAARGTDGREYPWGNDTPNKILLNYNAEVGDTSKVGSYPNAASPYGALDLAGNAWEWVQDWYSETYYASSATSNPLGPDSGQYRVQRGGSWVIDEHYIRAAARYWAVPLSAYIYVGFRCARSE
jgi:serine/threonine-protein kinase